MGTRKDLIVYRYFRDMMSKCNQKIDDCIKKSDIPITVINGIFRNKFYHDYFYNDIISYNYDFKYDGRFNKLVAPDNPIDLYKKHGNNICFFPSNYPMKDYESKISDIKLQMIYDMTSLNRNRHHITVDRFDDFTFGFDFDTITIVQSYCLNNNIEFEKFYKLIECIYSTILLDFDWLPSEIPLIFNQSVKPEVKEEIESLKSQKKFLPKNI